MYENCTGRLGLAKGNFLLAREIDGKGWIEAASVRLTAQKKMWNEEVKENN